MARLLGVHEVELRLGADSAEFERVAAEVASLPMFDGWSFRLLKGERGVRTGNTSWFSRSSVRRRVTGTIPRRARLRTRVVASTSRTQRRPMRGSGCTP
jgi:hypothetical protein